MNTVAHTAPAHTSTTSATALRSLGVIRAQGEDAAKFLHSQLTQDFSLLGLSEARLAGFCSAKGRLLASFVGFKRAHDDILLVCGRDVLPATLKRLSMFVLRAKVKLSDATEAFQLWGLSGTDTTARPWSKSDGADGSQTVVLYPAAGRDRALWVAPADVAAPALPVQETAQWDWLDVMSAIAPVSQPIVEAFVPQMLNYESVGGVNFKKGCYPGQEVVARSQFRGTLKRRAYLVSSDAALSVGQDVFHSSDAEQPCGTVAAAAANPAGGWNAIVSMQTQAAADGTLHAGNASGPALSLLPLPYPLLDDI
ncbi:folate-binding protein [Hydrogenophaga sp.]|uniref:CAF17-like 4Fe-4S cluster assembly/insertion protein YgfZ n=1 Tax=Hydrogenophaga sp. TaxID=1904254 RepID=UPI00286DD65F|nr:folate-binding protein [Hydrogenophaga sp.]